MSKKIKTTYVYVSDDSIEDAIDERKKRIYLGNFNGLHLCVDSHDEVFFKDGQQYSTTCWEHIVKVPKEKLIKITASNGKQIEITETEARELGFNI